MELTEPITRQEKVIRIQVRIIEELKSLSLEDLEDVLNGLVIARVYKSAHIPEEDHEQ